MRHLFFAFSLLLALAAQSVHAQEVSDDERARTHFEAGRSYYEQARYDDSAREFKEAFQLSGRAALLLNLSQAYERGLHFDLAIAELEHYLQITPNAPDRKTLEERIARLKELQSRVGQPGAATEPAAQPAAAPAAQPAPAAAPAPAPATAPAAAEEHDSGLALPGWILVGSGGGLLLGSVITGVIAHGKHSDLKKQCNENGICPASAQDDIDSGETMATVSTVLMGVGIVAAGVGVVLLVIDADSNDATPATAANAAGRVRLAAAPTPLGLGAQVSF
jgi:tetratricopeptide (TPR) repeat protein